VPANLRAHSLLVHASPARPTLVRLSNSCRIPGAAVLFAIKKIADNALYRAAAKNVKSATEAPLQQAAARANFDLLRLRFVNAAQDLLMDQTDRTTRSLHQECGKISYTSPVQPHDECALPSQSSSTLSSSQDPQANREYTGARYPLVHSETGIAAARGPCRIPHYRRPRAMSRLYPEMQEGPRPEAPDFDFRVIYNRLFFAGALESIYQQADR
jgi:hypothetical protein